MHCKGLLRCFALVLLIFCAGSFISHASQWPFVSGARSLALGGTSLCNSDVWAVQNNQAALGFFNERALGISLENRFLLKELSRFGLVVNQPVGNWNLGLNLNQFGSGSYAEQKLGLALGKRMGDDWSAGVGLHLHQTRYGSSFYPSQRGLSIELGLLYRNSEQFEMGFHALYPGQWRNPAEFERFVDGLARAGLRYQIHKPLWVQLEMALTRQWDPGLRLGFEYQPKNEWFLRAGYATNPDQLSFGTGFSKEKYQADLAFLWHPVLGFTPAISYRHAF